MYLYKAMTEPIANTNVNAVKPNTLKLTQVSRLKLKAMYQLSKPHMAKNIAQARFNLFQIVSGKVNASPKNSLIIFLLKREQQI